VEKQNHSKDREDKYRGKTVSQYRWKIHSIENNKLKPIQPHEIIKKK
jgi:hypothetical protein